MADPNAALNIDEFKSLSFRAGKVFTPSTPISTRSLFAGRWDEIHRILDVVSRTGLHAILYGERGVGKTSLANVIPFILQFFDADSSPPRPARIAIRAQANAKDTFGTVWARALDQISWDQNKATVGFLPTTTKIRVKLRDAYGVPPEPSLDDVVKLLTLMPDSVFVIDEFDRLAPAHKIVFTDLIKMLSDYAVASTIIMVGVAETIDHLVEDHASITRSLVQVHLNRMNIDDLRVILSNGMKELEMTFAEKAVDAITMMSQGLPHYTHLIGLHAVRAACARRSRDVDLMDVDSAFTQAVADADQTIGHQYATAVASAQAAALYTQVLLACAIAASRFADTAGYFQPSVLVEPLTSILGRNEAVAFSVFNKHLLDFCEDKRGSILERSGRLRSFRYRFRNPLLPPHILMRGIDEKLIGAESLFAILSAAGGPSVKE